MKTAFGIGLEIRLFVSVGAFRNGVVSRRQSGEFVAAVGSGCLAGDEIAAQNNFPAR